MEKGKEVGADTRCHSGIIKISNYQNLCQTFTTSYQVAIVVNALDLLRIGNVRCVVFLLKTLIQGILKNVAVAEKCNQNVRNVPKLSLSVVAKTISFIRNFDIINRLEVNK